MKTLKFTALNLSVLSLVVALTACQNGQMPNVSNHASSQVSKLDLFQTLPMSEQYLSGTWQLKDSSLKGSDGKSLSLKFENGSVFVLNGCNNMRASYQIIDHRLKIDSPISTRMMCEENLMQMDYLATQLFKGQIVLEKFVDALPESAYLKITLDGKEYKFSRVK